MRPVGLFSYVCYSLDPGKPGLHLDGPQARDSIQVAWSISVSYANRNVRTACELALYLIAHLRNMKSVYFKIDCTWCRRNAQSIIERCSFLDLEIDFVDAYSSIVLLHLTYMLKLSSKSLQFITEILQSRSSSQRSMLLLRKYMSE